MSLPVIATMGISPVHGLHGPHAATVAVQGSLGTVEIRWAAMLSGSWKQALQQAWGAAVGFQVTAVKVDTSVLSQRQIRQTGTGLRGMDLRRVTITGREVDTSVDGVANSVRPDDLLGYLWECWQESRLTLPEPDHPLTSALHTYTGAGGSSASWRDDDHVVAWVMAAGMAVDLLDPSKQATITVPTGRIPRRARSPRAVLEAVESDPGPKLVGDMWDLVAEAEHRAGLGSPLGSSYRIGPRPWNGVASLPALRQLPDVGTPWWTD